MKEDKKHEGAESKAIEKGEKGKGGKESAKHLRAMALKKKKCK